MPSERLLGLHAIYQSVRRGGRVTSEYICSGAAALAYGAIDALLRRRAAAAAEGRRRLDALEQAVAEQARRVRDVAHAALTAAGYRRHHRGEWRRTRVGSELTRKPGPPPARVPAAALDRYIDVVAAYRLAGLLAGEGAAEVREELLRDAEAVAVELAGPHPSAVEALLGRTISLDLLATRVFAALDEDRRVDRAHKRLLSSIKLLETIRRRPGPTVLVGQIVGQQQVNVGGRRAP